MRVTVNIIESHNVRRTVDRRSRQPLSIDRVRHTSAKTLDLSLSLSQISREAVISRHTVINIAPPCTLHRNKCAPDSRAQRYFLRWSSRSILGPARNVCWQPRNCMAHSVSCIENSTEKYVRYYTSTDLHFNDSFFELRSKFRFNKNIQRSELGVIDTAVRLSYNLRILSNQNFNKSLL